MPQFKCAGKLGDIIWGLPAIRALGGGPLTLCQRYTFFDMVNAYPFVAPLLAKQSYIRGIRLGKETQDDLDIAPWWIDDFRRGVLKPDGSWNLATLALTKHGLPLKEVDMPWLTPVSGYSIPERPYYVISRNAQNGTCHNPAMPWKAILECIRGQSYFLGYKSEHALFEAEHGEVPYLEIDDLAHASAIIAQATAFVGCQSVFHTIAEGLKKPVILEVSPMYPSVIFRRKKVLNVWTNTPSSDEIGDILVGNG